MKLARLFNTIKYLRPTQVYHQLWYRLKRKMVSKPKYKRYNGSGSIKWKNHIYWNTQWLEDRNFSFLNIAHQFDDQIDWNHNEFGKLWTYNLNYFDWLYQEGMTKIEGHGMIQKYCDSYDGLKDGLEPYPTSLRLINWVKFLGLNDISDTKIDQIIYNDANRLSRNLEYHLLANHLLENGFALTFAGVYMKDKSIYNKGKQLLLSQLNEQILKDGAHYELSPMYHQLMLYRVLDAIQLLSKNPFDKDATLLHLLEHKASKMISWLENITFWHGDIPLFNDSAFNINPTISDLVKYAGTLDINSAEIALSESGYRKLCSQYIELVANVGNIKPSYQPGHAHADSLSFVMYAGFEPFIVDRGISTYEKNSKRIEERSTAAHNTVSINSLNSSDVWGGFRVGRRASTRILNDEKEKLTAIHDGYRNINVEHERSWSLNKKEVTLSDKITGITSESKAHFHLHPSVEILSMSKMNVSTNLGNLLFDNCSEIIISDYDFANSFNDLSSAKKISVTFEVNLITKINVN